MVALLVHLHAQVLHVLQGIPAYTLLVLTHASRPDNDINTVHGCCISTNVLLDTVVVHLQSQMSTLVAFEVGLLHLAHVRADARDAEHTTLRVEPVGHLLRLHVELLHKVSHGRRIDVTRAATHHHTSQRGQTH